MNAVIEQAILDRLHSLDDNRLAEVLGFVEFIALQDNHTGMIAEKTSWKSLRGKYRNLMSFSEDFANRKTEEINLEKILNMQLILNYSPSLPDALHQSCDEFEREAKMAMAAKLYELKKLSSGMAATLIGMERTEFLLNLHRYHVAVHDLSAAELQSDFDNA